MKNTFCFLFFALTGSLLVAATTPVSAQERIYSDKRIIGGEPTKIAQHPWQVALEVSKRNKIFLCGGSIIARTWILTAAHCIQGIKGAQSVRIKAGVEKYEEEGVWLNVEKVIPHPKYYTTATALYNDVALLKVSSITNGEIIPLANSSIDLSGAVFTVTGWGATEKGEGSDVLRVARVPHVTKTTCNLKQSYNGRVTDEMICAGRTEGGVDSCQGDSGGPLVFNGQFGKVLVGVVSFGHGCAKKLKYGVYARVSSYEKWIKETMSKN